MLIRIVVAPSSSLKETQIGGGKVMGKRTVWRCIDAMQEGAL